MQALNCGCNGDYGAFDRLPLNPLNVVKNSMLYSQMLGCWWHGCSNNPAEMHGMYRTKAWSQRCEHQSKPTPLGITFTLFSGCAPGAWIGGATSLVVASHCLGQARSGPWIWFQIE